MKKVVNQAVEHRMYSTVACSAQPSIKYSTYYTATHLLLQWVQLPADDEAVQRRAKVHLQQLCHRAAHNL